MSNSDYEKDPETGQSINGYASFLNDAPVTALKVRCNIGVTLLVTEAELVLAATTSQLCTRYALH
jgi:hypothetical protein